jgi:hypothetical protein
MYKIISGGKAYPESVCSSVSTRVNRVIPLVEKDLRLIYPAARALPALQLSG